MSRKIANARKTMRTSFKNDKDFEQAYISNIAMLLHDRYNITAETRNKAAKEILQLIFSK